MGWSLRVTTRPELVGNIPVCLPAKSARQLSRFELALDPRLADDIELTLLHSVLLRADEVIV